METFHFSVGTLERLDLIQYSSGLFNCGNCFNLTQVINFACFLCNILIKQVERRNVNTGIFRMLKYINSQFTVVTYIYNSRDQIF